MSESKVTVTYQTAAARIREAVLVLAPEAFFLYSYETKRLTNRESEIMRVRTVITGISAGLICLVALWFLYYRIEPSEFVPGWPLAAQAAQLPTWTSSAILLFCGIVLFTCGWVAARWNWADNWRRSLQAGASMGVLAGCLIFDFVGAFWSSIKGQSEILGNYHTPVSEAVGNRILIEAILQTGTLLYVNFILILLICALLGGLGGITSALVDRRDFWGSDSRKPAGWLFRLPAYLLSFFGLLNMIITIAVLSLLIPKILNTSMQLGIQNDIQSSFDASQRLEFFSNLTIWLFAFLPLGLTWGWILRAWLIRKRPDVSSVLWIVASIAGHLLISWYVAPELFSNLPHLIFLAFACLIGVFIGFVMEERAEGFPYRFSDWVGYGLSYGILGGTQIVAGVLSYGSAIALIAIPNIPHLLSTGPVEQNPVEQVGTLFNIQYVSAIYAILGSIVIGLVIASIVSFLRTILEVKDAASVRE